MLVSLSQYFHQYFVLLKVSSNSSNWVGGGHYTLEKTEELSGVPAKNQSKPSLKHQPVLEIREIRPIRIRPIRF